MLLCAIYWTNKQHHPSHSVRHCKMGLAFLKIRLQLGFRPIEHLLSGQRVEGESGHLIVGLRFPSRNQLLCEAERLDDRPLFVRVNCTVGVLEFSD